MTRLVSEKICCKYKLVLRRSEHVWPKMIFDKVIHFLTSNIWPHQLGNNCTKFIMYILHTSLWKIRLFNFASPFCFMLSVQAKSNATSNIEFFSFIFLNNLLADDEGN